MGKSIASNSASLGWKEQETSSRKERQHAELKGLKCCKSHLWDCFHQLSEEEKMKYSTVTDFIFFRGALGNGFLQTVNF